MSDHGGAKAGKKGDGESSKKLTKAEMNTKLFDDQRKFYYQFFVCSSVFCLSYVWHCL